MTSGGSAGGLRATAAPLQCQPPARPGTPSRGTGRSHPDTPVPLLLPSTPGTASPLPSRPSAGEEARPPALRPRPGGSAAASTASRRPGPPALRGGRAGCRAGSAPPRGCRPPPLPRRPRAPLCSAALARPSPPGCPPARTPPWRRPRRARPHLSARPCPARSRAAAAVAGTGGGTGCRQRRQRARSLPAAVSRGTGNGPFHPAQGRLLPPPSGAGGAAARTPAPSGGGEPSNSPGQRGCSSRGSRSTSRGRVAGGVPRGAGPAAGSPC